jgi:hypothetical protein
VAESAGAIQLLNSYSDITNSNGGFDVWAGATALGTEVGYLHAQIPYIERGNPDVQKVAEAKLKIAGIIPTATAAPGANINVHTDEPAQVFVTVTNNGRPVWFYNLRFQYDADAHFTVDESSIITDENGEASFTVRGEPTPNTGELLKIRNWDDNHTLKQWQVFVNA